MKEEEPWFSSWLNGSSSFSNQTGAITTSGFKTFPPSFIDVISYYHWGHIFLVDVVVFRNNLHCIWSHVFIPSPISPKGSYFVLLMLIFCSPSAYKFSIFSSSYFASFLLSFYRVMDFNEKLSSCIYEEGMSKRTGRTWSEIREDRESNLLDPGFETTKDLQL